MGRDIWKTTIVTEAETCIKEDEKQKLWNSAKFCQKCRWQFTPKHTYTLDPTKSELADYAAVQAWCGNLSGNMFTHNLSGNIWPHSSQLAEPLWSDISIKRRVSVHELISISKRKKKRRQGMNDGTFSQNSHKRGKSHHHQWVELDDWVNMLWNETVMR